MRDLFKQPLSAEELRSLARLAPVSELFSWKSPTARQQGITPGSRTDEQLLELMATEPRLIRRPLTVSGDRVVLGADLNALDALRAAS